MGIIIRDMTENDIAEVERLENICFTSDAWSAESFLYRINEGGGFRSLVAEENGRFCGYVAVWSDGAEMYVDSVAVSPEYRRRGVASMLINEAAELCKPKRTLLEVRISNAPARALYGALGFREITVRKDYYEEPVEDGVIMER